MKRHLDPLACGATGHTWPDFHFPVVMFLRDSGALFAYQTRCLDCDQPGEHCQNCYGKGDGEADPDCLNCAGDLILPIVEIAPRVSRFNPVPIPKSIVYFLRMGSGGPVKIGYTANIESRLRQIGNNIPAGVILCQGWIPGEAREERVLHSIFAQHRIGGEWFHPSHSLLTFIEDYTNVYYPNFYGSLS